MGAAVPEPGPRRSVFGHLKKKLGAGLLVVIPVGVTLFIFRFLFRLADGFLAPYIRRLERFDSAYLPGLGIIAGMFVVYAAGLLATNVFGRRMVGAWEEFLFRIPLVKSVYLSAKQIMEVFAGEERTAFREAVYVDFPLEGTYSLALVTNDIVAASGKRYRTCFIPTSPNPTSGFVLVLEEELVSPAGIGVDEAMKIIVSGGMIAPGVIPLGGKS